MNIQKLSYKKSKNIDQDHLQKDRANLILERTYLDADIDDIEFWRSTFDILVQNINEQGENYTLIENELIAFKSILKDKCPPIEFVIDDEAIFLIFNFLQQPGKNYIKLSYLSIIDSFVTNIKLPLLELITDELIDSLLSILFDENTQISNEYARFAYSITKIFRTSSIYSSDFAKSLFNKSFYSRFIKEYIVLFNKYIHDNTIFKTFKNIIKIVSIWCQLDDSNVVDLIPDFINFYTELFLYENIKIDNEICFSLILIIIENPKFLLTLLEYGSLNTIWESVNQGMPIYYGMFLLSYCLIDENTNVKQSVKEMMNINSVLNISNLYIQKLCDTSDENKINKIHHILESSITLIANYLNCVPSLPFDVSLDELLQLIELIFDHANFVVKDCASFIILVLFSYNDISQLDTIYSNEFMEKVFDIISAGNNEVIEKAIDVFETLLQKASKSNDNINDYDFFNIFVYNFLDDLLETDQYDTKAESLLDEYYSSDF